MSLINKMNFAGTNFDKKNAPDFAIEFDPRRDINYFETLCLYCSDNDIDLSQISEKEFEEAADFFQDQSNSFIPHSSKIKFWID